jgi:hypothetical protein
MPAIRRSDLQQQQQQQVPYILPKTFPLYEQAKLFLAAEPPASTTATDCMSSSCSVGSDGDDSSATAAKPKLSTDKPRKQRVPPYARLPSEGGRRRGGRGGGGGGSSGYSSDFEQSSVSGSLPSCVDFLTRKDNKCSSRKHALADATNEVKNKRSKPSLEELGYLAHTVKGALTSVGSPLTVPLSSGNIDLSVVTLQNSKDYDAKHRSDRGPLAASALDSLLQFSLPGMIRDTACAYESKSDHPLPRALAEVLSKLLVVQDTTSEATENNSGVSDSESTTSSFTLSDEGLEGRGNQRDTADLSTLAATSKSLTVPRKSTVVSICKALSISKTPRYVELCLIHVVVFNL